MAKKNVWEPGVPAGWCSERKASKKKFDKRSFRTVCFDKKGERATKDTGAIRCVTVGCPEGSWSPKGRKKGYRTSGVCKKGTRAQRTLTKPGSYGCRKRTRPGRRKKR